ncbi:SET domain-containing protein [Synechococcus sp. GreenBA-s]|nr:SET domain-containing protein [Synechococcus sp. GreenBA-s]
MFLIRTFLEKSTIHGVGVFAAEEIPAGRLVWEFNTIIDRMIPLSDFHKLPEPAKEIVRRHAEFLESAQSFVLSGDNDRFMNHSESPSIRDEGLKMYANEFIPVGAELTCDYRHVRILDFVPV